MIQSTPRQDPHGYRQVRNQKLNRMLPKTKRKLNLKINNSKEIQPEPTLANEITYGNPIR